MVWDLTLVRLCLSPYRQYHSHLLTAVNGYKCDQFWSILVSLAAFSSTLFFKHQGNDLLRAKNPRRALLKRKHKGYRYKMFLVQNPYLSCDYFRLYWFN